MILCDTNVFIEVYKQNSQVKQELIQLGKSNICTSVVCAAELYFGAINKKELLGIQKDISSIRIIYINGAISKRGALELMQEYILSYKVGYSDFLIAATALYHHFEIYTFNKKDFHFIPGIKFYK
jgi:tRNA(fMet)-specific endonuclease VapC